MGRYELAREFVLLDNTYCCGVLSADGHQWCMTGYVTDYLEKSFAGFPRSYPDGCGEDGLDALSYSPAGFIWDAALAKGRTVRAYGEFCAENAAYWTDPGRKGKPGWLDMVADWEKGGGAVGLRCRAGLPAMRDRVCTNTAGLETSVPDVLRADRFIRDLKRFEASGDLPQLVIICLPNDHTSGTKEGMPTPEAHVADNDLAFGRIVEAVSRSRFWKETCIVAIEGSVNM